MPSEKNDLGKLTPVKNKRPRGNEQSKYLATKLDFPKHGVKAVLFRPGELVRPLARALRQKDDIPETLDPEQPTKT